MQSAREYPVGNESDREGELLDSRRWLKGVPVEDKEAELVDALRSKIKGRELVEEANWGPAVPNPLLKTEIRIEIEQERELDGPEP